MEAYGWDDLVLDHDFHELPYLPENDRVRFTISELARLEVLDRLADLNRQRYEEEVARGLHRKKRGKKAKASRSPRVVVPKAKKVAEMIQAGLDFEEGQPGETLEAVLDYLRTHSGWHAKSDVLASVDLPAAQWSATISDLVERGLVERKGQKRGTRYRAVAAPSSRTDTQ